jgi:hypothetical protein
MTTASFDVERLSYPICHEYNKKKAAFLKGANCAKSFVTRGRVIER